MTLNTSEIDMEKFRKKSYQRKAFNDVYVWVENFSIKFEKIFIFL